VWQTAHAVLYRGVRRVWKTAHAVLYRGVRRVWQTAHAVLYRGVRRVWQTAHAVLYRGVSSVWQTAHAVLYRGVSSVWQTAHAVLYRKAELVTGVCLISEMQVAVTVSVDMNQILATDLRHDKFGVTCFIGFTAERSAVSQTVLLTQAVPRASFTLSLGSET